MYEQYLQAQKLAQKECRQCAARGEAEHPAVLDELLAGVTIVTQERLGLVDIPLDRIAGTKTRGRQTAFSPNFMPLLELGSEFSNKWANLAQAHLDEGIQVPIKAYEYMNRFYVEEGNKRVSVLKFFGAASIPGTVTRLIPQRDDSLESRLYYEFLDFYKLAGINYLQFTREGSYAKLQNKVCKAAGEVWNTEDRKNFHYFYNQFKPQFEALGGDKLGLTVGDGILVYLNFYRYAACMDETGATIRENLKKIWDEVEVLTEHQAVELLLDPHTEPEEPNILEILLTGLPVPVKSAPLKIAFLHELNSETSAWTRAHKEGRLAMESSLNGRVEVTHLSNVLPGVDDAACLEEVLNKGAEVVFTTSSQMMPACLKAAAKHPEAKILNCSLNVPHPSVRTYAPRMYEAKYLLGMLAGIYSQTDTVGYVANYPIYGVPAGINAFALGLRAVRPQGRVLLRWVCLSGEDGRIDYTDRADVTVISGRDQSVQSGPGLVPGLVLRTESGTESLARPVWRWDVIYKEIVRSILDGTWKNEEAGTGRALNYWWGMSSDAVSVEYAPAVPEGTLQLLKLVQQQIAAGSLDPFAGELRGQDGTVKKAAGEHLDADARMRMNWLLDNVDGRLPHSDEAESPTVRSLIDLQGVEGTTHKKA